MSSLDLEASRPQLMLRFARPGTALVVVATLLITLSACDFGDGESLYDPDAQTNAAPVIASITPDGVVLAGVDVITINGQNYSSTLTNNSVVFDDAQGNSAAGIILEASPTQLRVQTPNLPNTALRVRVSVIGAQNFSNSVDFPLTAAVVPFGDIGPTEVPFGFAADTDGTVYLSLSNEGSSVGVIQIAPDGTRAPYFSSTFPWAGLARLDGELIGIRRVRAVFGLPEGGSQRVVAALQPSSLSLGTIAAGPSGSIYTGGNVPTVYHIRSDGSTAETTVPAPVTALGFAGSTLYAATTLDGVSGRLFAMSVAADGSLGAPVATADLPAVGTGIAIAADGTVFVGLDRDVDPILEVSPSGTASALYPGVLEGPATGIAYGAGTQLYMVRGVSETPTPGTTSVPPPNLLRIETRRDGSR